MPKVNMGSRRRHSFYQLLTGSAAAVWLMTPGTAWADCTPDPTPANGSVTCTGSDADGLTINTNQTTVNVQAGATVSSMTATTIGDFDLFKTANPSPYSYYYPYPFANNITINTSGQISGGLTVLSGTAIINHANSPSTNVTLNVASGGSVSGATAINLIADPAALNPLQARAYIGIDNSGSIQSTTGPAITGNSAVTPANSTATTSPMDTACPRPIGGSARSTARPLRSCRPSATANSHPMPGLAP